MDAVSTAAAAIDAAPPESIEAPADAGALARRRTNFAFTGNARDYFRIWIVNLLLTLATLGLWSPWAKVRKRRYLYGHAWRGDANFEYDAEPIVILRGRLIAAAAVFAYWVVSNLVPAASAGLFAALALGAPWIVARSLAFNASRSSHRGIRFAFLGTPREVANAIWPLLLWAVAFVYATHVAQLDVFENPARYTTLMAAAFLVLPAIYPLVLARARSGDAMIRRGAYAFSR